VKDVEDGRDCTGQRLDIADIDTRLYGFGELTATQLVFYRVAQLADVAEEWLSRI